MSRVVALCEGGPLNGQEFSVTEAAPLFSRFTSGVLYVPDGPTDAPEESDFGHDAAIRYRPATEDEAVRLWKAYWEQFPDLDAQGNFTPEPEDG